MCEKKSTPWELAEWLRIRDDGHDIDGALFREAAEQLDALSRIHAELDGREWCADDVPAIAEHLTAVGLECRDPNSCDCDSRSWHGDEHDTLCPLAGLSR